MRRLFPLKAVSASCNNSNSNNFPNQRVDKDGQSFWEKERDYSKENPSASSISVEKEIDMRPTEWASMLQKTRYEGRRMRKRIKDLAEKNVELQRESSYIKSQEIGVKTQVTESQQCMDDLRIKLAKAENEIVQLRESLSKSIESDEGFKQLQQELKDETLLVKILREKLCSNAADLEQFQEDVATFVRIEEVLRSNIESLQGRLSNSNQKEKELELLLGGKDITIRCLQADLQECLKELTLLRGEIPKVSEERDGFQQDAERLTLENIKLVAKVETLQIRADKLEEDVHFREGQLSILQESLNA